MSTAATGALSPEVALAMIGVIGVGAQWLAWRLRMPAIVLMLVAGLIVGPVTGLMVPSRDIGAIVEPMISIAVAIILFEGGLTLNLHRLRDAADGVKRLVIVGAPVGWFLSAAALYFVAGLDWAAAIVFGGIMIVTGPTVIAPLLRSARLSRRPAMMLQWEAIVNDPLGAMAAVLAFSFVVEFRQGLDFDGSLIRLALAFVLAGAVGWLAGWLVVQAFRRALVPEYMKVPVLFVAVLAIFVLTDFITHESGLLAVTMMGLVIANSDLPSFIELRRFKEHATILLVSGVFILLAASMDLGSLQLLGWQGIAFLLVVIFVVRPATVLLSLLGTAIPFREQLLVGLTGPRGVVLVAVAGLFGERLVGIGVEDGHRIVPLAFALVATTVILHGFTLAPLARALGLASTDTPGLLIVGGSRFSTALGKLCQSIEVPVMVTDRNFYRLREARKAGLPNYYGDVLSEGAEVGVDLMNYGMVLAGSENDPYNTLVATDLAPEFGRDNVFQFQREKEHLARHALPATLGGRSFGRGAGFVDMDRLMVEGWELRATRLSEEFTLENWREMHPEGFLIGRVENGRMRLMRDDAEFTPAPGVQLIAMVPPEPEAGAGDVG
ncbi:sodium/proton antiporter (CPA1 family) [Aliiruegeria haliotis]|uniref:Sodium/proton antiporter (CPA1 family) n=1 Tax=Aliiruegeria haliotis TaxID=1280846 RepID=A0A2T0RZR3_9RHOB|nr:sodium:proton antiporter [Aliiruegeria haliotis]PRY26612.1 sodium/proton antiporter (CPA1 family) [Aliiruegeria haliotis]